ncbi:DUF6506 family protein [Brucella sp. JSBI001]|uniref:DUF6506 family protein n=1 Tax=Brucella sp. JSBI001 TaxID=2886044 RepID=UPI002231E08F|nr:DUF6506 family protein [Brucella sp. JSBI001]UZD69363.1 DUF6506 family protein [Brucella sp. JSBI001]
MNVWATIILWEDADPKTDRTVRETAQEKLTIAFVPTVEAAATVASELVEDGAELIELCGGFGLDAGAVVSRAVDGRAAVGAVAFGIESITQAAAYKAKFEAASE